MPGRLEARFKVQDFCIRERADHPQIVATSRHVSCGAVDLVDVRWRGDTLSGVSDLVGGDPYDLYLTEPPGYRFVAARTADGAEVASSARAGALRFVRLRAVHSARVAWRVVWRRGR